MKTKTEKILAILRIITWIAMIGYAIECGSQLITLLVSFKNPDAAKQISGVPQNLINLVQHDTLQYVYAMSFVIVLSAIKVHIWLLLIKLLSKLNLENPFSMDVTKLLEQVGYALLGIWLVGVIAKSYIKWLSHTTGEQLNIISTGNEFLFIAGIVYIISQIFKRGIEIQEENHLTV